MSEIKPVYQARVKEGSWVNCLPEDVQAIEALASNHWLEVRALYPAAAYEALKAENEKLRFKALAAISPRVKQSYELTIEELENERDKLKQDLEDLQERFNGIKFIESELRKELEEFEAERNRRDEMRKALEAQMGISNKGQS